MIITVLKNGQLLMKEVLEGIARNNENLLVITSHREKGMRPANENKEQNIREALQYIKSDFMFIDSDVILKEGIIEKVKEALKNFSIVVAQTYKSKHGLTAIRKGLLLKFKEYLTGKECAFCKFLVENKHYIFPDMQGEIERKELKCPA